jgi:hypothetical protein
VATDAEDHAYDSATYGLHQLLPEYDAKVARSRAQDRERSKLDAASRKEAEQFADLERRAAKQFARERRSRRPP